MLNSRGTSMLEVIFSSLIIIVATAGISVNSFSQAQKNSFNSSQLLQLREQAISYINHPYTWLSTVENSSNKFEWCRNNATSCYSSDPLPLDIISPTGTKVIGNKDAKAAFNNDLSPCILPADQCAFSVEGEWKPICSNSGSCSQAKLSVRYYAKGSHVPSYDIDTTKNTALGDLSYKIIYGKDYNFPPKEEDVVPIKLIVILDNSESMDNNLVSLRESFKSILKGQNKDLNAEILIYTTSSKIHYKAYNETKTQSAENRYDAYAFHLMDLARQDFDKTVHLHWGQFNELIMGSRPVFETYTTSLAKFVVHHELHPDRTERLGLKISTRDSEGSLNAKIDTVFQELIDKQGHNSESGICTLNRILMDEGPHRPFDPNSERVYFFIMSDENDSTFDPNAGTAQRRPCVLKSIYEKTAASRNHMVPCPAPVDPAKCKYTRRQYGARYVIDETFYTVTGTITYKINGETVKESLYWPYKDHVFKERYYKDLAKYNLVYPTQACSSEVIDKIFEYWAKRGKNKEVERSNITKCSVDLKKHEDSEHYWQFAVRWFPNPNDSNYETDYIENQSITSCNDVFKFKDDSSERISDKYTKRHGHGKAGLTMRTCEIVVGEQFNYELTPVGLDPRWRKLGSPTRVISAMEDEEFNYNDFAFRYMPENPEQFVLQKTLNNIESTIGRNQFYISTVSHTNKDLCEKDKTGSFGSAYHELVSQSATPTENYNICDSNYDISVNNVIEKIQEIQANTIYFENWPEGKELKRVYIVRQGQIVRIDPKNYYVVGKTITFNSGTLINGDKVEIVLKK